MVIPKRKNPTHIPIIDIQPPSAANQKDLGRIKTPPVGFLENGVAESTQIVT